MKTADLKVTSSDPDRRIAFLDHLRYLFVFGVVLQHAAMAYVNSGWWPVDEGFSMIATLMVTLTDGFLMPGLFFISGYFAIPSIRKRNISGFLNAKIKRLGLPWLTCILFICPILPLVYHYTRNGLQLPASYLDIWLDLMQHALAFDVGLMPPKPELMQNNLFYQRYMWFISLLITFFLVFSLIYRFRKRWFEPTPQGKPTRPSVGATLKRILYIGTVTFSGSFLLIGLMFLFAPNVSDPESWFTLGNLVQFRVSRVFLHITYFALGIFAYKSRWIDRNIFPGHRRTLIVFFLIITFFYLASRFIMAFSSDELALLFGMIFWLFLNFFTISALGVSISLTMKYLNRSTPLNQRLAGNAFNIYLAHYLIVIGLQLLFLSVPGIPLALKYGLVSTLSLICTYAICRFLITPHPRITVALLVGLFGVMVVTLKA